MDKLEFDGERYVPGEIFGNIEQEHIQRYLFATQFTEDKIVLDIACGEGYGTAMISKNARFVYGIDLSEKAINHAQKTYSENNIKFIHADCRQIPIDNNGIDVIICYETIEHIFEHNILISEFKRILKKDGILIISSPDKKIIVDEKNQHNKFHLKELYRSEFESLLNKNFKFTNYLGQKVIYGSILFPEDKQTNLTTSLKLNSEYKTKPGLHKPVIIIGIASDIDIQPYNSNILESHVLYSEEATDLQNQLNRSNANIQSLTDSIEIYKKNIEDTKNYISNLEFKLKTCETKIFDNENTNFVKKMKNTLKKIVIRTFFYLYPLLFKTFGVRLIDQNELKKLIKYNYNLISNKELAYLLRLTYLNSSKYFDEDWYLSKYNDVKDAKVDPLVHFLTFGKQERRNPNSKFDTGFYLDQNPDILYNNINPLLHYIFYGESENRRINNNITDKWCVENPNEFEGSSKPKQIIYTILTTQHTLYVANLIKSSLNNLGFNSIIDFEYNVEDLNKKYIVICPQIFKVLPKNYIAFQMEQSTNSRWFTEQYFKILNESIAIFDYSLTNIEFLLKNEFNYKKIYYMPISTTNNYRDYLIDSGYKFEKSENKVDLLFYGDTNCERRKKILDRLSSKFNIKIINDVFGDKMINEICNAKIVVNLHYYESSLLETTRICECLSLETPIISESTTDVDNYPEFTGIVKFTEKGNILQLEQAIEELLSNKNLYDDLVSKIRSYNRENLKFRYFFYRALMALDEISYEQFTKQVSIQIGNIYNDVSYACLSLPETPKRYKHFIINGNPMFKIFDGLRSNMGWIGCAMSYKFILQKFIETNLKFCIICEDDTVFYNNFANELNNVLLFLRQTKWDWDIFCGLIADLSDETKILGIEEFNGEEYIFIDKMTSTVMNIYSRKGAKMVSKWSEKNKDPKVNTIDRYIEKYHDKIIVTKLPFIVGHDENMDSSLWGFQNSNYNEMILKSQEKLYNLVELYKRRTH